MIVVVADAQPPRRASADRLIVDERAGRRVAGALGLRVAGVLGLLVLSEQRGRLVVVVAVGVKVRNRLRVAGKEYEP